MSDSDEEKAQQSDSHAEDASEGERSGASRREFIKKVAYVAPVIETFLLSETAYGSGGSGGNRGRGEVADAVEYRRHRMIAGCRLHRQAKTKLAISLQRRSGNSVPKAQRLIHRHQQQRLAIVLDSEAQVVGRRIPPFQLIGSVNSQQLRP